MNFDNKAGDCFYINIKIRGIGMRKINDLLNLLHGNISKSGRAENINIWDKLILYISAVSFLLLNLKRMKSNIICIALLTVLLIILVFKLSLRKEIFKKTKNPIYFGTSVFISFILGYCFYNNWRLSSNIKKVFNLFGIKDYMFNIAFAIAVILTAIVSTLFISLCIVLLRGMLPSKERISCFISNNKGNFLILFFIYLIGTVSILRANFNYIDDKYRVNGGSSLLGTFGRYTDEFLEKVIHADFYLTDVSPLPQILAVFFLAIAGTVLLYLISPNAKKSYISLIALIPLGLSPYFLECISYKYDAPYMALSILSSILPALWFRKSFIQNFVFTFIGTMVMCTTYQVSAGIYPMLIIFLSFRAWRGNDNLLKLPKQILISVLSYLSGLIVFKMCMMPVVDSYVDNSIAPIKELPSVIFNNYYRYFSYIISDFKAEWIILVLIIILSFIFINIISSRQNKIITTVAIIFTTFCMALLSFGVYPLFKSPSFSTRAMYGIGVVLALMSISIFVDSNTNRIVVGKISCIAMSWVFFVFSFTYGNALYVQKGYEQFRSDIVAVDLSELEQFKSDNEKTIQIYGAVDFAEAINNMSDRFPIIKRLIFTQFRGWRADGFIDISHCYGKNNVYVEYNTEKVDLSKMNLPLLRDTMYHTIYGNDEYIYIVLK